MAGYTATEKAGFSFYALIRGRPPIDRWIETREYYLAAKPKVRIAMMDAERARLNRGFASYVPGRDAITIRTRVHLKKIDQPDSSKILEIEFPGSDQILYFPFQLGDLWVALVPFGLETKSTYTLTATEYSFLSNAVGAERMEGSGEGGVELVLMPVVADGYNPVVIGGVPLWPVVSNVLRFSVLDSEGHPIWHAPSFQKAD